MAENRWRVKAGALAAFVLAVAAVAVALGLGSGSSDADPPPTAGHRALAMSEAGRLLRAVRLPGGATTVTSGDEGVLSPALQLIGPAAGPNVAQSTRTWSVAEPAARVAAFLLAHPVVATRAARRGAAEVVDTADRPPAGLSSAAVAFVLSRGGPHTTIVHASARVTWLVPRAASEVVPAAAHVVDIIRGKPGRRPGIALMVTDPQLSAIRRLIDALPTAQPGVTSCPEPITGLPRVTFVFRTHEGGKVLAVAGEDADVVEPTTACDPLDFSIGGRSQTPLLRGARLLRQVSRIVRQRLWLAPYAA